MNYADRPWLKSYMLGPYKLAHSVAPYPQEAVSTILDRAAQEYTNQTAIFSRGVS